VAVKRRQFPSNTPTCSIPGLQTRIHETGHGDDLAQWVPLGRWDGRSVTRDGRLIEGEENCAEEGGGLLVRIGLEVRMGINDEGGADGGEPTSLQEQVRGPTRADDRWQATHENKRGVEVFVVLLDVVHIVLGHISKHRSYLFTYLRFFCAYFPWITYPCFLLIFNLSALFTYS